MRVFNITENGPEEPPKADKPMQTGVFQRVPVATGLLSFALRSDFATRLRGIFWDLHIGNYWKVQFKYDSRGYWYVQITDDNATDNMTGLPTSWSGRKWLISEYMTDGEIVQTVFKAYMTALEHEGRENFYYKGATIFDPHYDLDRLVEARTTKGAIKERDGEDKLNG